MTQPPSGWSAPGGQPGPGQPPPPGYYPPQYQAQPTTPWYAAPPPPPGVVPLRPLGLGEILDGAIKVIRRYPRPSLGLAAAIAVVVTLVDVALLLSFPTPHFDTPDGPDFQVAFGSAAQNASRSGTAGLLSFLGGLVLTGALITVVGNAVQGKPVTTGQVWAAVRPRIWALLGLSLLTGLLSVAPVAIGILIAVILGFATGGIGLVIGIPLAIAGGLLSVYLFVRLSLAPAALILEKVGVTTALKRSGVLVRTSWWRVFGILLLTSLITSILSGIIAAPISIVAVIASGGSDGTPFLVATRVGAGLASVLISPFSAGVRALLYVDRRMRAEGLDVALQAATGSQPR